VPGEVVESEYDTIPAISREDEYYYRDPLYSTQDGDYSTTRSASSSSPKSILEAIR